MNDESKEALLKLCCDKYVDNQLPNLFPKITNLSRGIKKEINDLYGKYDPKGIGLRRGKVVKFFCELAEVVNGKHRMPISHAIRPHLVDRSREEKHHQEVVLRPGRSKKAEPGLLVRPCQLSGDPDPREQEEQDLHTGLQ